MVSSVYVRIFIAHRAIHSLSHEIVRLDLHLLIELQLSAINALQDRHRDRQLVNAMHREMLVAVQVRRFAHDSRSWAATPTRAFAAGAIFSN